jgi:hypothetical protein
MEEKNKRSNSRVDTRVREVKSKEWSSGERIGRTANSGKRGREIVVQKRKSLCTPSLAEARQVPSGEKHSRQQTADSRQQTADSRQKTAEKRVAYTVTCRGQTRAIRRETDAVDRFAAGSVREQLTQSKSE